MIGHPEIFIIFLLVLLLFGAKMIPQFARSMGQAIGEFRTVRREFKDEVENAADKATSRS